MLLFHISFTVFNPNMKSTLISALENRLFTQSQTIAIADVNGVSRSYHDLGRRVARIQNLFPIDEPRVVGIILDQSIELIETTLAVVMSGATVVNADPEVDSMEIKDNFQRCGVEFVMTIPRYASKVSGFLQVHLSDTAIGKANEKPLIEMPGENAYALRVDSGFMTHSEVMAISQKFVRTSSIHERDIILQVSTPNEAGFVREVFGSLLIGGKMVVMPKKAHNNAKKILEYAEVEGVTIISAPVWLMEDIISQRLSVPTSIRLYIDTSEMCAQSFIPEQVAQIL